jgi:hypothetical protein
MTDYYKQLNGGNYSYDETLYRLMECEGEGLAEAEEHDKEE